MKKFSIKNSKEEKLGNSLNDALKNDIKKRECEVEVVDAYFIMMNPGSCKVKDEYVDKISKIIEKYAKIKLVPGDFVDADGNILGRHKGIINYTVGQRKGLGVTFGKPMFVTKIDAENNLIAVKGAIPGAKGGIVVLTDSVKA